MCGQYHVIYDDVTYPVMFGIYEGKRKSDALIAEQMTLMSQMSADYDALQTQLTAIGTVSTEYVVLQASYSQLQSDYATLQTSHQKLLDQIKALTGG